MESILGDSENTDPVTGKQEPSPNTLAQLKSGANWFYWIAGLSLINSAIFAFGGNVSFIAGLAFTQIIDALVDASVTQGSPTAIRAVAIGLDLILVAIFALLGYYANKAITAVFIAGIIIYLIDALLWLFLGSYFAAGFHAFALFNIIRGFIASREINSIKTDNNLLPT